MTPAPLVRLFTASVAALQLINCGGERKSSPEQQAVSYASREAGSVATPTHETSFQLLAADGPTRLASLQNLIIQSGKQCRFVTSGVLKGGLDGTDEWRVKCVDSGEWAVWFRPAGAAEIIQCASAACM
jgi:hypothetical protein